MAGTDNTNLSETTRRLAYFEATTEKEKTRLSRALHDELGGLLVAAAMDTSWAEQHLVDNPAVRDRLYRIRAGIAAAIQLKRKLIEGLRPTLLENFGLIAALRWYHEQNCECANLKCMGAYPTEECQVSLSASNVLFRVVQEALSIATRQPSARSVDLLVSVTAGHFCICVTHDGDVLDEHGRDEADAVSIWLIENRICALGGEVRVSHPATGGMVLDASVPWPGIINDGQLSAARD
jgi:signal transduction histidine kinase